MSSQTRFLAFKQQNMGRFDIPCSYENLVLQKQQENIRELDSLMSEIELDLKNGQMRESSEANALIKKIKDSTNVPYPQVIREYNRVRSSTVEGDQITYDLMCDRYAKKTKRQNLGEKHTANCIEYVHSHTETLFGWDTPQAWIDENGRIVETEQTEIILKKLDYHIVFDNGVGVYCAQKRMNDNGGHQDNQINELRKFSQATKNAPYIPVAILDGEFPSRIRTENKIASLNDNIVITRSNDLYYFVEWLQYEVNISASIQAGV